MLNNGDKIVVKKKVADFLDVGDIAEVVNVMDSGTISFTFGDDFMHMGLMSVDEFEEHFDKVEEKKDIPTITTGRIEWLVENSDIKIETIFDKCVVVSCRLPNGYEIVESYVFTNSEEYNEDIGMEICISKIAEKLWELETYRIHDKMYGENDCDYCENNDCSCCECDECDECDDEWDEDNVDCDNCEDYDCPNNPNR